MASIVNIVYDIYIYIYIHSTPWPKQQIRPQEQCALSPSKYTIKLSVCCYCFRKAKHLMKRNELPLPVVVAIHLATQFKIQEVYHICCHWQPPKWLDPNSWQFVWSIDGYIFWNIGNSYHFTGSIWAVNHCPSSD